MNIKAAREHLKMSLGEFATLHGVTELTVRRWEYPPGSKHRRETSGSTRAFTEALLDGYRPAGWTGK